MHVHWNMNIHFPLLMTGENPQGTEFMLLGIQGIRIHALGLRLNRSEGKIKSNNPSNSRITRKTSGAYGEDIFPGSHKIWPLLKQPNYNGPWSTGCLLNPLNFLMGYHIPTSTSRQMSKSWRMTASKTRWWFKSKWQSRECIHRNSQTYMTFA